MRLEEQIFEIISNIKFHQNQCIGRRVVPCGQTDGQTNGHDEAFRNFAKASKYLYKLYDILVYKGHANISWNTQI